MHMVDYYGSGFWGMHLLWWGFWIFAIIALFGFNVPERTGVNSFGPITILKRRLAKGEISEEEYKKIEAQLRSDEEYVRQNTLVQAEHTTRVGHPIIDGLSLSTTWVIFYSLCGVVYWAAPDVILTATGKLFHGLSFTQMAQAGNPFDIGDFAAVLTIGAIYTFAAGSVWSLIHSFFLRQKAERSLEKIQKRTVQKNQLSTQAR